MSNAGLEEDRRVYLASLSELRSNDLITADDETRLIRHYDDQKASIEAAFAKFLPEYQRRVREDGEASANEWMATAAHEMGQREGDAARRLSDSLSTSSGGASP